MSTERGYSIDTAAWGNRWLTVPTGYKALLAGGLLLCALLLPPWPAYPLIIAVSLVCTLGLARVPLRRYVQIVSLPIVFIAVGAIPLAFSLSLSEGIRIAFDPASLEQFVTASARAATATFALLTLALTTPAVDLVSSIARIPRLEPVAEIALLIHRFTFILLTRVRSTIEAQTMRLGYSTRRTTLHSSGMVTSGLLLGALENARGMDEGLVGRGFTGTLARLETPRGKHALFVPASLATLSMVVAVSLLVSTGVL